MYDYHVLIQIEYLAAIEQRFLYLIKSSLPDLSGVFQDSPGIFRFFSFSCFHRIQSFYITRFLFGPVFFLPTSSRTLIVFTLVLSPSLSHTTLMHLHSLTTHDTSPRYLEQHRSLHSPNQQCNTIRTHSQQHKHDLAKPSLFALFSVLVERDWNLPTRGYRVLGLRDRRSNLSCFPRRNDQTQKHWQGKRGPME